MCGFADPPSDFCQMEFRKITTPQFFDGYMMHEDERVLICQQDGTIEDVVHKSEAGDNVEKMEGILSPGFINCHGHLELSHMRSRIPEETGLAKFVASVVTERQATEEVILSAIERAENEMLDNGIVAAGDICNNAMTIRQKLKGRIWYHNFIEATGYNPAIVEERFQRSLTFFSAYGKLYSIPVESNSITPHAAYSVADELWEKIIHFPGNHLFSIHNQETEAEDEWFKSKTGDLNHLYETLKMDVSFFSPSGKSSIQTYLSKFLPNQSVILVHNVHTKEEDIDFANETGRQLHWCLCPNANWYISRKLPDIELFIRKECSIVLGTDSLASNYSLNLLDEMKRIRKHFPGIKIASMLQWATINGARALMLDSLMGSFEKGKKPGVIQIDSNLNKVKRIL